MALMLIGKRVDHGSIGWAMQRIPPEYLDELAYDLYLYSDCVLKNGVYIVDSSGFTCDLHEKRTIKMKERKVKQTVNLHTAVKHYPRYGVTAIVTGKVTRGRAHDSPQFKYLICRIYGPGFMLGDKGYDSEENRRLSSVPPNVQFYVLS